MPDFTIKKGDRLPSLRVQFLDADGAVVDLTGKTVAIRMKTQGVPSTIKINNAAVTVEDAAQGIARYDWAADDVNTEGTFDVEFAITTTASGKIQTVPASGYLAVKITAVLA